MRTRSFLTAALLALTSCLNVNYTRQRTNEPIPEEATVGLRPDESTLGDVIAQLGSPTIVWPSLNGKVVLAYAWQDQSGWGISLSYNMQRVATARLEWDSEHAETPAIVMQFDPDLRLRSIRRGLLRDIIPDVVDADLDVEALQTTLR